MFQVTLCSNYFFKLCILLVVSEAEKKIILDATCQAMRQETRVVMRRISELQEEHKNLMRDCEENVNKKKWKKSHSMWIKIAKWNFLLITCYTMKNSINLQQMKIHKISGTFDLHLSDFIFSRWLIIDTDVSTVSVKFCAPINWIVLPMATVGVWKAKSPYCKPSTSIAIYTRR